jgi:hypothetical protein
MIVFVLWRGEFDDRMVVAIYSTREKAEAGIKSDMKRNRRPYFTYRKSDYDIEEITVDDESDL